MVRILLADDHEIVRRGLRGLLEAHPDWEVCAEAENGREAVDRARESRPDVAVLDLSLPELNGLEVLEVMAREALTTRVPVLMLGAEGGEAGMRRAMALGARRCLGPVDMQEVVAEVRRQVEPPPPDGGARRAGA